MTVARLIVSQRSLLTGLAGISLSSTGQLELRLSRSVLKGSGIVEITRAVLPEEEM